MASWKRVRDAYSPVHRRLRQMEQPEPDGDDGGDSDSNDGAIELSSVAAWKCARDLYNPIHKRLAVRKRRPQHCTTTQL